MFTTKFLIFSSTGEAGVLLLNSSSYLVLRKNGQRDTILCNEPVTSYDGWVSGDGVLHIFFTSGEGALMYLRYKDSATTINPVMLGKDSRNRICSVRALAINGRFHLFYCLDTKTRYLVHQVVAENGAYEPEIVDVIGKRFVYDVVTDENMDIHILYLSPEGTLRYKKYIYSRKIHTGGEVIHYCEPRSLCSCCVGERLFAAYTELREGRWEVYLLGVSDSRARKVFLSSGGGVELSLNDRNGELIFHIVDNGICYEISGKPEEGVSPAKPLGKSNGIFGVLSSAGKTPACRYPCTRDNEPFRSYSDIGDEGIIADNEPVVPGAEVEGYAEKHRATFDKKLRELRTEELLDLLARIEAALVSLVRLLDKDKDVCEASPEDTPSTDNL